MRVQFSGAVVRFSRVDGIGGPARPGPRPAWWCSCPRPGEPRPLSSHVRPVALPSNLEADPVFQPFLDKMSQSSPTFGRQVGRLAAETGLHVRVLVEDQPRPPQSSNARTVLTHRDGSLVSAHVYLKPSPHAMELIAHELEHVLERLDGVDLQTQAGSGMVWKSGDGSLRDAARDRGGPASGTRSHDAPCGERRSRSADRNPGRSSDDRDSAGSRLYAVLDSFGPRERERAPRRLHFPGAPRRGRPQSIPGCLRAGTRDGARHPRERRAGRSVRRC